MSINRVDDKCCLLIVNKIKLMSINHSLVVFWFRMQIVAAGRASTPPTIATPPPGWYAPRSYKHHLHTKKYGSVQKNNSISKGVHYTVVEDYIYLTYSTN